jgi:ferredoxin
MTDARSAKTRPLEVDSSRCVECGGCVPVCAFDAIFLRSWGIEILDDNCTLCGLCVLVCPTEALIRNED